MVQMGLQVTWRLFANYLENPTVYCLAVERKEDPTLTIALSSTSPIVPLLTSVDLLLKQWVERIWRIYDLYIRHTITATPHEVLPEDSIIAVFTELIRADTSWMRTVSDCIRAADTEIKAKLMTPANRKIYIEKFQVRLPASSLSYSYSLFICWSLSRNVLVGGRIRQKC